jgi:hypothetical protein
VIRDSLEALVAAFNRGSLDVPAGFLTPRTTFSLNGRSYESMLGGSPDDPLIRLLARGAGAYRSAAKAVQYALQQPSASIQSLLDGEAVSVAQVRIEGVCARPTGRSRSAQHARGELQSAAAACPAEDLLRIATARGNT